MKRFIPLIIFCLLLPLGLAACSTGSVEPEGSAIAGVPNPLEDVDSPDAFEDLGIYINAPAGAETLSTTVIDDTICQIVFLFEGHEYTLRCAQSTEDISGVYDHKEDTRTTDMISTIDMEREVTITQTEAGGAVAIWFDDPFAFSLYTADAITTDEMLATIAAVIDEGPKG